jgi:malate permease and related proteins
LTDLLGLFSANLLPVFLAAAAGFLLGKVLHVEPRPLSQAVFYVFSPCLVFDLITRSSLNGPDVIRMMAFAAALILSVGLITWFFGWVLKLERRIFMAVLLTAMFMNAGNYGLSVNLFAFGEEALAYASLFFVTAGLLTYTIGVVIASLGSSSLKQALGVAARLPTVYALIVAFIFLRTGWELPLPAARTVEIFSAASIPTMLLLLGLQLSYVRMNGNIRAAALAGTMRLLIAPLLAVALTRLFGLEGAARQAGILEAAMPTAVLVTVLATEYDVEPSFVTTMVILTTLLSPFTLTPLLAYLGA